MSGQGAASMTRAKVILARQAARGLQAVAGVVLVPIGLGVEIGAGWGIATAGALLIVTSGYWRNWR